MTTFIPTEAQQHLDDVLNVGLSGVYPSLAFVVGTAALCYSLGMPIFAVIAASCVFVPCLFGAIAITLADRAESGVPLNAHFKSIGAITYLAIALLAEPQTCFFGFAGRCFFWFLPRTLLLGYALDLMNNPPTTALNQLREPPPPYSTVTA